MVFENLLDPALRPLLALPMFWAIFVLSLLISLIITLVYKFTTNQSLMKDLKEEMKAFQKQIRELRNDPQKAMEVQKVAMKTNMKYMSHSMRSTLYTFIPIIIIFGWMNAHLSFAPILPNEDFTTTIIFEKGITGEIELSVPEGLVIEGDAIKEIQESEVKWILNGQEGEYLLEYHLNDNTYSKDVIITNDFDYKNPFKRENDGIVKEIKIDNKKNVVVNFLGWKMGWLATYIILSIIFSMLLRKIFRVY